MRLLPFVLAIALFAPLPTLGQEGPLARSPNPAGVSDAADKLLWCGHALIEASPQATASGDAAGAAAMVKDGNTLIDKGAGLLAGAGFDAGRIKATRAGYAAQVRLELAGTGPLARYGYDECLMLTPAGAALLGGEQGGPSSTADDANAPVPDQPANPPN